MKEPLKKPINKYCFLRYNSKLRFTIEKRMKLRGFPLATLAKKYNIQPGDLRRFLYSQEPKDWRHISQWAVIKLCNELGIELELSWKIKEGAQEDFVFKRDRHE